MSLNPQIDDLGQKVRLRWTPDTSSQGYRLYIDGIAVSRTFKSDASETTFQKPSAGIHRYGVQKMDVVDALEEASWPATPPPPPAGNKLSFAPPLLSSPSLRTLTNAARSVPKGSGQDLRITFGETLTGNVGQIEGYDDHTIIGGKITGGSSDSSGHIIPRENTGIAHYEGLEITLGVAGDAFTARWRTPKVQIGGCRIRVTDNGGSFHSDGFQTQQAMHNELIFDLCTFETDYQGIFQSNEVSTHPAGIKSQVAKTIIRRTNFKASKMGYPATWWFKAFPPRSGADVLGVTEIYEAWIPDENPLARVYPNGHTWTAWNGSATRYGAFLETRRHPILNRDFKFVRFSTSGDLVPAGKPLAGQQCGDCGVRGDGGFWVHSLAEGCPFGDFWKLHTIGNYALAARLSPQRLLHRISKNSRRAVMAADSTVLIDKPVYDKQ